MEQIFATNKIGYYALACCILYPVKISIKQSIEIINPDNNRHINEILIEDIREIENAEMCRMRDENIPWNEVAQKFNITSNAAYNRVRRYLKKI